VKIDFVREKLSSHTPTRVGTPEHPQAAVAVILREGTLGSEVLLIERAIREGDPWSGHMAFPGGRREPDDDSTRMVAHRETFEEVGLELDGAEYLGRLDDPMGNPRVRSKLVISAHAFHIEAPPRFVLDPAEVQNVLWFPLAGLHDESRWVEHEIPELPEMRFPGVVVGDSNRHVVWGLTYRFLDRLLEILDCPFPDRWGDLSRFVDAADGESAMGSKPEQRRTGSGG
jgi:8-oxo-dGTP pyrophosphatase MutT (NUDIX family)